MVFNSFILRIDVFLREYLKDASLPAQLSLWNLHIDHMMCSFQVSQRLHCVFVYHVSWAQAGLPPDATSKCFFSTKICCCTLIMGPKIHWTFRKLGVIACFMCFVASILIFSYRLTFSIVCLMMTLYLLHG
jgi:hypothetical protein